MLHHGQVEYLEFGLVYFRTQQTLAVHLYKIGLTCNWVKSVVEVRDIWLVNRRERLLIKSEVDNAILGILDGN